jgi:hypothetical protein
MTPIQHLITKWQSLVDSDLLTHEERNLIKACIVDAHQATQNEQRYLFKFVKTYYAPESRPCDLGAEEMFEAEFYLNYSDFHGS